MVSRTALAASAIAVLYVVAALALAETQAGWRGVDLRSLTKGPLHKVFFVDDRVGWVISGMNEVLKSADGGLTWVRTRSNLNTINAQIGGLSFVDKQRGWAATKVERDAVVWHTRDGGTTWTLQGRWNSKGDDLPSALLDIQFNDEHKGWAVGMIGAEAFIIGTTDGGKSWQVQYRGGEMAREFKRVHFIDGENGWALSYGAVLRTVNGGDTWQLVRYDPPFLIDIAALVNGGVWIAGGWGTLWHTPNGSDWSEAKSQALSTDEFFAWVAFADEQRGWVASAKCALASTADGGKSWRSEACPVRAEPGVEWRSQGLHATATHVYAIFIPPYVAVRKIE